MENFKRKMIKFLLTTNYCWSLVFAGAFGCALIYISKGCSEWFWYMVTSISTVGMVGVGLKAVLEEAVSCGILRIEEDDGA